MDASRPVGPFLDVIRSTYPELDRWRARAAESEQPQIGSELSRDDRIFPPHRISETMRMSLALAGEHLRLARDAIEARQLYPSAHFTVLRGSLIGAAQAVWVLSVDDAMERQQRGLTIVAEMYVQMRKYYRRLEQGDLTDSQFGELRDQQSWLDSRMQTLTKARTREAALNLSDVVIPWAVDYVFRDRARRLDGRSLWALMSGDAHVLGWSTMTRGTLGRTDRGSGLAEGVVGGSAQHIAQPFILSHQLLRAGWSLFDRRCEGA